MKIKNKWFSLLIIALTLIISACGNKAVFEPREVNPNIDACEVCNMSIAHTDFATQLIETDGTVHMYDDIGCMVKYLEGEGKNKEIAATYVRDNDTMDWVPMEEAYYAYHPEFWTPMAYGVVPFATKKLADAYVKKEGKGEVLDYKGLDKVDWVMQPH
ncbi:nitrous oxide reductase accessory protein NosL [Schinkia sp. CFF1]